MNEAGNGKLPLYARLSARYRQWWGGGIDPDSLESRLLFLGGIRDFTFIVIAFVIPILTGIVAWRRDGDITLTFGIFMGYFELVAILAVVVSRLRLRDLQATLRSIDFEKKILAADGNKDSPVLLFLKHQSDLKRYYDQALQHSSLVFFLGIFCVLAGLATVGVAFFLVNTNTGDGQVATTGQIVTGVLGAVGAILSGFVAKVYLGIHRGAIESLNDFHDKLVQTHHLHFAGVLAARVEDKEMRDKVLLEIAKRVPNSQSE